MAQNLKIANALYEGVPSISIPTQDGGEASFVDTTDADAVAEDILEGKSAYVGGAKVIGTAQQADWAVTDTSSKAYIKNKPENLVAIGNNPQVTLNKLSKDDNDGNPVYFLMHELVKYSPSGHTWPTESYGFNGIVFGYPRLGNGDYQLLTIVKVGLGYEYSGLYSSSTHYSPVVIKDETNNKYYWAMKIGGSYQDVYMLGAFTTNPLNTAISAIDRAGTLPKGWRLLRNALPYLLDNTHVAYAAKDRRGNMIDITYATKSDISSSVSTSSLTVTGETSVPTANEGNSSKAIASTEFVAKSIAKLVDSAPESLNTLNELSKALGNDPNFATTVLNELGKKLNSAEAENTYEKIADASNVHTSLQNSINSLSTGKQDKLTFDTTPIAGSSNPVTSDGIKKAIDAEASARKSADETLQTNINTEASTRKSADDTLQKYINDEISARESADNTLAKKDLSNVDMSNYVEKSDYQDAITSLQNSKQDKLTFDSTPTAGSSNPVTSDGVKKAIANAISAIVDGDSKSY